MKIIAVEIPGPWALTTVYSGSHQGPGHYPWGSELSVSDVIRTEQTLFPVWPWRPQKGRPGGWPSGFICQSVLAEIHGARGVRSGHSVYTALSAPKDIRVGWDGMGEVTEANVLATRGTADITQADLS